MANPMSTKPVETRPGWATRLLRGLTGRPSSAPAGANSATAMANAMASSGRRPEAPRSTVVASSSRVRGMARQLVQEERYVFVLLREALADVADEDCGPAWDALARCMALIPTGTVPVVFGNGGLALVEIPAFHIDRHAVTNRQFQRFVDSGGYDNLEIWPQEVWPSLMKFTDKTRRPGPRDWENGRYPASRADHPVVGVCWYEANAYATWVGKRLPNAAEWQKAGGWPEQLSGGSCTRYPWGDVFEPTRANLWSTGPGQTVPVSAYPEGSTPNGIDQMTGNVWEWLADPLDAIPCHPTETLCTSRPMRRIVGGAFDTYFPAEATNQFVTGQPELDRRENIGFRCAVSVSRLRARI